MTQLKRALPALVAAGLLAGGAQGFSNGAKHPTVPEPDAAHAVVPNGFKVDIVTKGLTYPTSVEFDNRGNLYVAEAGYSYGDSSAVPRIYRLGKNGKKILVAKDGLRGPINDLLWHKGRLYVSHRGRISLVMPKGQVKDLVTGLPSHGDHHNNQLTAGPDGRLYFGQGTATNSGVVGVDNARIGWLEDHPNFHDVMPFETRLAGHVYKSLDPVSAGGDHALTSPFQPFDHATFGPTTVEGRVKANGTILSLRPDGTDLSVYAWGFRNPFGLLWGRDGALYATENGFDERGSRPIANDPEDIYTVKEGAWYGWPDYSSGQPVTSPRFKPENGDQPRFVMLDHPPVQSPFATFPSHSAVTKIGRSPGGAFGDPEDLFVAFFGHMSPATGTVEEHFGHRVVRLDPQTGKHTTFFSAKDHENHHGHEASAEGTAHGGATKGPRRLMDVRVGPDGNSLYIVDFGAMFVDKKGVHPVPKTGLVWRVRPAKGT